MLSGTIEAIREANSRGELLLALVDGSSRLGFEWCNLEVAAPTSSGYEYDYVGVLPDRYDDVFGDAEAAKRDPVLQHVRSRTAPTFWDQAFYAAHGAGDLWEEQAPYGMFAGVVASLRLEDGRRMILGLDAGAAHARVARRDTALLGEVQLLTGHARDAYDRMQAAARAVNPAASLTDRECEVLQWLALGKTAWETGQILGITETTVKKHLMCARQKLDAVNATQAVAIAMRAGLLR